MTIYLTEYEEDGKTYAGENVEAETWDEAVFYAHPNKVIGVLAEEVEICLN